MKVYAAIYTHKDGPDMRVFGSREAAENCRTQIAKENWHNVFDKNYCMPDDPKKIADVYFDKTQKKRKEYESFVIEEFDVE
jgi:hypothetical protein